MKSLRLDIEKFNEHQQRKTYFKALGLDYVGVKEYTRCN